jgi:hypothetical protein
MGLIKIINLVRQPFIVDKIPKITSWKVLLSESRMKEATPEAKVPSSIKGEKTEMISCLYNKYFEEKTNKLYSVHSRHVLVPIFIQQGMEPLYKILTFV